MKKNLGPKNYIYPLPVLIVGTYGEVRRKNQGKAL